jgi:hypothetical protein
MKKSTIYLLALLVLIALFLLISATSAQWLENGVVVNGSAGDQTSPEVVSDLKHGSIIIWRDRGVVAQRINAFGDLLWNPDGVSLCRGNTKQHTVVADMTGGAVIAWSYRRAMSFEVYLQRLSQAGVPLWAQGGLNICNAGGDKEAPHLTSNGAGDFIVMWRDGRNADGDIYAQKVTETGETPWGGMGLPICTEAGDQEPVGIVSDGSGGAIIAWRDSRGPDFDIYAQRIDGEGTMMWPIAGIAICTETGDQDLARIEPDGSGGAIIVWQDARGSDLDIYAQRIDKEGALLWTAGGVAACVSTGDQDGPEPVSDGAGGAIITWCDRRGSDADIFAQRIDASGGASWSTNGVSLCSAPGDQSVPKIATDGARGAIVTWQDLRGSDLDIYTQRILKDGRTHWQQDGVILCNVAENQMSPRIVPDGSGGAIMPWEDARNGELDIYAQRIDGRGRMVMTFLAAYKAYRHDRSIVVKWTMERDDENLHLFVLRATSDRGPFRPLFLPIEHKGRSYSFVDDTCEPGSGYTYRVEILFTNKRELLFQTPVIVIPSRERMRSFNSPNPFNPTTTISYVLDEPTQVKLDIYDVAGRRIASLVDAFQEEGEHDVIWNGRDGLGAPVASGIYFYRLSAGDISECRKMILLR